MMFKINEQFKVIGKGTSLKASEGEFILHHTLSKATLIEVAKANNVKVNKKADEKELFKVIEDSFNSNEAIPTMNDKTENKLNVDQKYVDIIQKGFEANKDADSIQVDLVKAGLKFKAAAATFKKVAEHLGFKMSAKERTEAITKLLNGAVPKTYDDVEKAVKFITGKDGVKDTSEAQALAVLRKICKDAEVEFPKKPKGKSGGGPRGFKAQAYKWIIENKDASKKDLEKFLAENEQRPVFVSHYWDIMQLCREYAKPVAKAA